MKLFLAAAVAVLATPAIAQDTPAPPADQEMATPAPAPETQTAPDAMAAPSATAAPDAAMADPVGGYQPANPPMPANVPPGATVRFQAAPSPSEAYPAPAAMTHYPPCKKGQYDNCVERGSPK